MYSPFPVSLAQLTVEHVDAFLAGAEEEGVTWEAKADALEGAPQDGRGGGRSKNSGLRPDHVRRGVCALANQVGGHFLVGAAKHDGRWQLVGVAVRDREPGLWLDQALRGLRPVPRYRHRVFPLDEDRWAAVIEVEPLTQTPCMTLDGQVFERVSSESVRVTDPARLAELFRRGEAARQRAEAQAAQAVQTLRGIDRRQLGVAVTLGLAAASYEPDIGSRLFHSRFRKRLDEAFDDRLFRELSLPLRAPQPDDHAIRQSYIERVFALGEVAWRVRAGWDGAVAVSALLTGSALKVGGLFDLVLLPAWRLAADLVADLGGYGDARVNIAIEPRAIAAHLSQFYRGLPALTEVTRWAEIAEPDDALIGSVQRELQRAAGFWTFEGAPNPPEDVGG